MFLKSEEPSPQILGFDNKIDENIHKNLTSQSDSNYKNSLGVSCHASGNQKQVLQIENNKTF